MSLDLSWLPVAEQWTEDLRALKAESQPDACWAALQHLSRCRLDPVQTSRLDREARRKRSAGILREVETGASVRVVLLGSSTLRHLVPSLRVAGMRRGMWMDLHECGYGQYMQALLEPTTELRALQPEIAVFALDARHLDDLMVDGVGAAIERIEQGWLLARERFGATVIQQTVLPVFEDAYGSNEHRLPDSSASRLATLNAELRNSADRHGVTLLSVDRYVQWGGIDAWHSRALWHMAKQEVHPGAASLWGDLLTRLIAAERGRSSKCLVLDLDHTLWGGGIGDDGLDGITIGRGSALGEAHLEFQRYCLALKRRGVILAVCSKNDEANARAPFEQRPEMLLQLKDFAVFVANWKDKASNLRSIAKRLRIGLDSLVFADDNPAERELIRRELPEVMVPEMPEDPAGYVGAIARAGYFEGLVLTAEDRDRAQRYAEEVEREGLRQASTDMRGYLQSLRMEMSARSFDETGLRRIVQLANKTNQFNLTTLRVTELQVRERMSDPGVMSWQISLRDRFGDHGVVALIMGRVEPRDTLVLDMWLMSCRVLGRGVEDACMDLVMEGALERGIRKVVGVYRPTAKNGMVRDLYERVGFLEIPSPQPETEQRWEMDVARFVPRDAAIQICEPARVV